MGRQPHFLYETGMDARRTPQSGPPYSSRARQKELRVLIVQSVEPGGLLHVVGKLVGHSGKEFVLPGLLVLLRQQSGEGAVVQNDVPPQQVVTVLPP